MSSWEECVDVFQPALLLSFAAFIQTATYVLLLFKLQPTLHRSYNTSTQTQQQQSLPSLYSCLDKYSYWFWVGRIDLLCVFACVLHTHRTWVQTWYFEVLLYWTPFVRMYPWEGVNQSYYFVYGIISYTRTPLAWMRTLVEFQYSSTAVVQQWSLAMLLVLQQSSYYSSCFEYIYTT